MLRVQSASLCSCFSIIISLQFVLSGPSVEVSHHEETVLLDEMGQKLRKQFTKLYSGEHIDAIALTVPAFDRNFTLDLELNKGLFAAGYREVHFSESGEEIVNYGVENCYYHGVIRGIEDSSVVVSTCNGMSGSFAHGTSPESYYYIEPVKDKEVHVVYKASDLVDTNEVTTCGVEGHLRSLHSNSTAVEDVKTRFNRFRRSVVTETKYTELLIVNDYRQFIKRGSVAATGDRAKSIANFVDSVYKALRVRVALVAVETWNNGDKATVAADAGTTLDNFLEYREDTLLTKYSHDIGELVSNRDFTGTTVGIAPLKGMCKSAHSGGINQDTGTTDQVGAIMAHEMGHTFGMEHDDLQGRNCKCTDTSGAGCLMESSSNGIAATVWSDCSNSDLTAFLNAGSGSCLFNVPTQLFGDPVCGNAFVETGEECDCGSVAECQLNDPCCEPGKCKLKSTSQCSQGLCCENCKFKAAGSSCRSVVTNCDLQEFCGGSSKDCPVNLYKQDGTVCDSNTGYCYQGECKTIDKQCKYVWGSSSSVGNDVCYTRANKRGDQYGHCGISSSNFYIPCTDSNVRCGLLQCQGGGQFPVLGGSSQVATLTYTISGTKIPCKGASIDLGTDVPDPGLIEDGTKCDADKVCVSRVCTAVSSLTVIACPKGSNGQTCSGKGVCNNVGDCHCNSGYIPPSCSSPAPASVNGAWGPWSAWSTCSVTCNGGTRSRIRYCDNPPPSNGGKTCTSSGSSSTGQEACNQNSCPVAVNGGWGQWGSWTTCSATCNSGIRSRFRQCNSPAPQNGGASCFGSLFQNGLCNTQGCPVNGFWSSWLPWSSCTKSCGTGTRTRKRACDNPTPVNGGSNCAGTTSGSEDCNKDLCTVVRDGQWGGWSVWSACTSSCGSGSQNRIRKCDNPPPLNGGKSCTGDADASQSCTGQLCARDGQWGTWTAWSACPVTCGGGPTYRLRTCSNPEPTNGGKNCSGNRIDETVCGTLDCTVNPGDTGNTGGGGGIINVDNPGDNPGNNPGDTGGSSGGSGNGGIIAGAVIGVLALAGIGAGAGYYAYRRNKSANIGVSRRGMYAPASTGAGNDGKYSGYQPPQYHGSQDNLLEAPDSSATTFVGDPSPIPKRKGPAPLPPFKQTASPAPKPPVKPVHRPPPPPGKPASKPSPPPGKPLAMKKPDSGPGGSSSPTPMPKPKPRPGAVPLLPPSGAKPALKPPKQWPPSRDT